MRTIYPNMEGTYDLVKGSWKFPYCIELFDSFKEWLEWQFIHGYRDTIFDITESGYPKVFAMGYTLHKTELICVLKKGNWKDRLLHEIGHELHRVANYHFVHSEDKNSIMYPYFNRGNEDAAEILAGYSLYYGEKAEHDLRKVIEYDS